MTYCVALKIKQGIVFASDSRTNAGVDHISTVSKMHVFTPAEDRIFVIMSAGNLATTQEVLNHIKRDIDNNASPGLMSCQYVFEAAEYLGQVSQNVQQQHTAAFNQSGVSGEATFIIGGQIQGQENGLYMVYPQGNYISATKQTPFLQIGETKYGKPVLDRILTQDTTLDDAARLTLVSLDSTRRANISVGPPYDVCILPSDNLRLSRKEKFQNDSEKLKEIIESWATGLQATFNNLPRFDWEQGFVDQNQNVTQTQQPGSQPIQAQQTQQEQEQSSPLQPE